MSWLRALAERIKARILSPDAVDRAVLALLVLASVKAVVWALLAQQVPDEHGYFAEIRDIALTGQSARHTGHIIGVWAYSGAVVYRIGDLLGLDPLVAVRLYGAACTVIVAWLGYRTAKLLSDGAFLPLATLILIAFNPMYSFIGSSANSDTMQTMWATAAIAVAVLALVEGPTVRRILLVFGFHWLTGATKSSRTVLVTFAVLSAALALIVLNSKRVVEWLWRARQGLLSRAGLVWVAGFGVALWLASPLLKRWAATPIAAPGLPTPGVADVAGQARTLPALTQLAAVVQNDGDTIARHFWGYFGLLHVPGPPTYYLMQTLLVGAALAGVLIAVGRGAYRVFQDDNLSAIPDGFEAQRRGAGRFAAFAVLIASVAVALYAIIDYALTTSTMVQGRYLLTLIMPVCLLIAAGLSLLVPKRFTGPALATLLGFMAVANAWALFYLIVPYFFWVRW